MRAAYNSKDH